MKRFVGVMAIVAVLTLPVASSWAAPDVYDESQAHPLRVAAYLAYPVGYALEWLIFRPFHFLVASYPDVSGHKTHGSNKIEE